MASGAALDVVEADGELVAAVARQRVALPQQDWILRATSTRS